MKDVDVMHAAVKKMRELSKESPWVTIKVPMNDVQAKQYIGEPCDVFEPRCAACKGWAAWSVSGEVPVLVDRNMFFARLFSGGLDG